MRWSIFVAGASLILAAQAPAPVSSDARPSTELPPITKPKIRFMPPPETAACYYPERAYSAVEETRKLINNEEVVECTATAEGHLAGCKAISENPKGFGFGTGAMKLASTFEIEATDGDGAPVDGRKMGLKLSIPLAPWSTMKNCHVSTIRRRP